MVFVPHSLAYFTQHNAPQFHPCHRKGYELLHSLCCVEFHCVNIPQFFYPLIYLGCFQNFANINCTAMNIGVHRFLWIGVSVFLEYNTRSGIARSKCSSTLYFYVNIKKKITYCFPKWLYQSAFPPTMYQRSLSSTTQPTLVY